jgi:hypothetical protein
MLTGASTKDLEYPRVSRKKEKPAAIKQSAASEQPEPKPPQAHLQQLPAKQQTKAALKPAAIAAEKAKNRRLKPIEA